MFSKSASKNQAKWPLVSDFCQMHLMLGKQQIPSLIYTKLINGRKSSYQKTGDPESPDIKLQKEIADGRKTIENSSTNGNAGFRNITFNYVQTRVQLAPSQH